MITAFRRPDKNLEWWSPFFSPQHHPSPHPLSLLRSPAHPILTENRKFAKLEVIAQRRGRGEGAAAERISIWRRRGGGGLGWESGESNWLSASRPPASSSHECHRCCLNSLQCIPYRRIPPSFLRGAATVRSLSRRPRIVARGATCYMLRPPHPLHPPAPSSLLWKRSPGTCLSCSKC